MRIELTEVHWVEQQQLSLPELVEISRLPQDVLQELLDCGAIAPTEPAASEPRFGAPAVRIARVAARLRVDFELDTDALAVVLGLLERVEELQGQVQALRARQPHSIR